MKSALAATVVAVFVTACRHDPAPPPFEPVGKGEAEAFGRLFATLLERCRPGELAPRWNAEVTARRAVRDTKADGSIKDGLVAAFTAERLWEGQCQGLKIGASKSHYLGVREVAGTWRPLIRILGDNGLNYAELELGRFPHGAMAVDATYYNTGEPLSRTLSRLMGSAQTAMDDGTLGDGQAMLRITQRAQAGDSAGALAIIQQLPPALRKDKAIMLMEVGLDPGDDEARYLAAIDRFEKAYPADPALDLVSIDGFFLRQDWRRMHANLDRLDRRVADPYLDVMRSLAYRQAGTLDKALAAAKRATAREPELRDAWDAQSQICIVMQDFACAVGALEVLAKRFDAPTSEADVRALEGGAALVASDAWKAWQAAAK
jgi:hypothetical protein